MYIQIAADIVERLVPTCKAGVAISRCGSVVAVVYFLRVDELAVEVEETDGVLSVVLVAGDGYFQYVPNPTVVSASRLS